MNLIRSRKGALIAGAMVFLVLYAGVVLILPWLMVTRTQLLPGEIGLARSSPDGRHLAIGPGGSARGQLYLLDLNSMEQRLIGPQTTYASWFLTVWSPDGRRLIYQDAERVLRLFERETGRNEPIASGHAVRWSAWGDWFAVTHTANGTFVGSVQQPDLLLPLFPPEVKPMAINPDGGLNIGSRRTGRTVELVAAPGPGEPIEPLETGLREVVAVSPDGRRRALLWPDGRLELTDADERRIQTTVTAGPEEYFHGWWSPDAEWLALVRIAEHDRMELLILRADGQIELRQSRPFWGYRFDKDSGVWWSPDSQQFALGSYHMATEFSRSRKVHVFSTATGRIRSWRLPGVGGEGLDSFQWIDARTLVGQADSTLYHFRLR